MISNFKVYPINGKKHNGNGHINFIIFRCPGVSGPCFDTNVSAVYCNNIQDKCKVSSFNLEDNPGICKIGEQIFSQNRTFWCLKNYETGLKTLTLKMEGL